MGKYGKYRPLVRLWAVLLALWPASTFANCRQALAIGLDISGSVDRAEYRLQMDGLARALIDADVERAFLAMPGAPVSLFVFEWSGAHTQLVVIPWTSVTGAEVLRDISQTLLATDRRPHEITTALGNAMIYGGRRLASQQECWRLTMDLSGDGQSNIGPRPRDVQDLILTRVTINAIVIGHDGGDNTAAIDGEISRLSTYFQSEVIRGPAAFVETALGFEEFEAAMARKLLKELQTPAIGQLILSK